MYNTDPVTVAIYARKQGLLDEPGWQLPGIKRCAKTKKHILRHANQAKLHSFCTKCVYVYGVLVPQNYQQVVEINARNGDTKWMDATDLEIKRIDEYETFRDKGKDYRPGPEYKKIQCHFVCACKHDGRCKARLEVGGHLTDTPIYSVCSSVVSLRGIRTLTFLGEHNDCKVWVTNIGNAYLESKTQEKVYVIGGAKFRDREGHCLIISKALYGLCSSGLRWSEHFTGVLRQMNFFPSQAERDIWMRDMGDHYECIAVCG